MTQLPSGRFVGIMSERARLHAARLKLQVNEHTPHQQLYPLIDILIEPPLGADAAGKALIFSGYTLADRQWIGRWQARDSRAFLDWIAQPAQVRTIELARRHLLVESSLPSAHLHPYPERLYSLLQVRIAALPQRRATAAQWQRTILNMKHSGLRREEIDWSGIIRFLAQQPPQRVLDKAVVLGALDFSAIQPQLSNELECDRGCRLPLEEVARRVDHSELRAAGYVPGGDDVAVVRYRSRAPDYRLGTLWRGGRALAGSRRWFVFGPRDEPGIRAEGEGGFFPSFEAAREAAGRQALGSRRLCCDLTYRARYDYMSLHGGEDYREWLVTLPEYHRSHFTAHFYERNVLLHIRSKVRTSQDGSRVLFIEEMQSDWHQALARFGLRGGIPIAPFRKEWASLALKLMLLHVVENGLDGIAWADAGVHELRYDRPLSPLRRLYDEQLPAILNRLARPWQAGVGRGRFATRSPWLHAVRSKECWKVEGGAGRFATRARYSKHEALAIIERHSRPVTLELPMLRLPEPMRRHIAAHGLPLFGEQYT